MSEFDDMAKRLAARRAAGAAEIPRDEEPEIRMNIRVDKHLRDAFVASCQGQDTTAARELRDHMRKYVAKHGQGRLL